MLSVRSLNLPFFPERLRRRALFSGYESSHVLEEIIREQFKIKGVEVRLLRLTVININWSKGYTSVHEKQLKFTDTPV